jgi:2-iminobutanoate/2-iminopropanoate deaminase
MGVSDVVKLTVYFVADVDVDGRRAVLGAWLRDHRPCMTVIFVSALAEPAYRVEVEAWYELESK